MTAAAMLCGLLGTLPVAARPAIPPLPHEFYGALTIDGRPASTGTTVEARGEGVLTDVPDKGNPITTEEAGRYGGPSPFDPKLIVQGEDLQNGDQITFYVDGVQAECYDPESETWLDVYAFQSGMTTKLDLRTGGERWWAYMPFVAR